MKELKELKLEEMTIRQKVGFVMTALIADTWPRENFPQVTSFVYKLIKERSLGAVWVNYAYCEKFKEALKEINEIADYPILIITDAENGLGDYTIGSHNSIGMADSEELAYTFGKLTATTARQWGYNTVCDPVVDMVSGPGLCGSNQRSLGSDKEKVTALAKAVVRGMHDSGVLSIAKHYPSAHQHPFNGALIDSHMAETYSTQTKEELMDYCLYPYLELMKEGLLDGIMTGHKKLINIDPDYPGSLSKKVIDIIRDEGFEGIAITDALQMMGVVAKFGTEAPLSLCIAAGNDLALPWTIKNEWAFDAMVKGFEDGVFDEETLDKAVSRVLAAQHKVYEMQKATNPVITEKDIENYNQFAPRSVFAKTDEGVSQHLDKDGKYCFFVQTDVASELNDDGTVNVDTFKGSWFNPNEIIARLKEEFPNSVAYALSEYPLAWRISRGLSDAMGYDVVFLTYNNPQAYVGKECLSSRVISMMQAMQVSDRISTVVHFGNPYVLEDVPHVPRIIVGGGFKKSVDAALDVLAGKAKAQGTLTYDVKFN